MKPPFGDVLDSDAVVGLGELTLLLAPKAVREWGHQGVRSVMVGSVDDDSLAGLKKIVQGVEGESGPLS